MRFERIGPKVLLVAPNEVFRSVLSDAGRTARGEAVVSGVGAGGFQGRGGDRQRRKLARCWWMRRDFFLRDAHGVAETLSAAEAGRYKLDASRSTIALDGTKAFPKNTEVEAVLTFTTDAASAGRVCARRDARSACA